MNIREKIEQRIMHIIDEPDRDSASKRTNNFSCLPGYYRGTIGEYRMGLVIGFLDVLVMMEEER